MASEFLNYPEDGLLANFRMMPESFWALVEPLETRGRDDHWHQNSGAGGGGLEASLPANNGRYLSMFLDQQAVHLKGFE